MSKFTKLIKKPRLFLKDAIKNKKKKASIEDKKTSKETPKTLDYYTNPIINFKNNFPVNSIKYKNSYFWPFLKNELIIYALLASLQIKKKFTPSLSQMCHDDNISYEMIKDFKSSYNFKTIEDIKPTNNCDFLFFSSLNSVEHVKLENGIYNKFIDSIFEEASKIGKCKKVEIIKTANQSIHKIPKYINKPICILPDYIYSKGYSNDISYPKHLFSSLKKFVPYLKLDKNKFDEFVDWQIHMVNFYKKVLLKFKPKVIFFFPYFYNTPLTYAANSLKIKTVEIQHGIMSGDNSLSYDNWQEIPFEGYDALPNYFWVWGNYENQRLEEVLNLRQSKSKSIVGGLPWLETSLKIDETLLSKIKRKIKSNKFPITCLITLQKDQLPTHIIKLIELTEKDVLWLIRKHPKWKNKKFSIKKSKNVLLNKNIDNILLSHLFTIVDIHFTANSTSVLEADYFGVYNYIYEESGYKNYKDYIDKGLMGYYPSNTCKEIIDIDMFSNDKLIKKQRLDYISKVNTKNVLLKILND